MSSSSRSGGPSSSAPRAIATDAPTVSDRATPGTVARELVDQLVANFRAQVHRALGVELDGSEVSLAFVDHYLSLARDETREPIVALLAAGAGAYFGECVAQHIGATWIGDGRDPRHLRLLVRSAFIYFSPVDQAYEAIAGTGLHPDDARLPGRGAPFDPSFHLQPASDPELEDGLDSARSEDTRWLQERLAELPPVSEDEFHSLTCRFETLKLMLELLAAKHASEGHEPVEFEIADYLAAFSRTE